MSDYEREAEAEASAEDGLSPNYRTGDAADEPLEQDLGDPADEIEEAVSEARSADPRIAEPPS